MDKRKYDKPKPAVIENNISPADGILEPSYKEALSILVGNVPVLGSVSYERHPGPAHTEIPFRVEDSQINAVNALKRGYKIPTTLTCQGYDIIEEKLVKKVFKNLFVLDGEPHNDVTVRYRLVNCLYWYSNAGGFTFTGRFNIRRDVNDFESLDAQGLLTFRKDRYLEYSIKPNGRPYTALEILVYVLNDIDARYGVRFFDNSSLSKIKDNKYIPDDREYIRVPAAQLISELCRMAHVGIDCFPELDVPLRLYTLDESVLEGIDSFATVIEDTVMQIDKSATRNSEINVGFTVNAEVWLTTAPSEDGGQTVVPLDDKTVYPYIYNVMPAATNISAEAVNQAVGNIDSETLTLLGDFIEVWKKHGITRGTWLPIKAAVEFRAAQDSIDGQTDTFAIPLVTLNGTLGDIVTNKAGLHGGITGLDEPIYTRGWFEGLFVLLYTMSKQTAPDYRNRTREAWAAGIMEHLYQTYRINSKYLDNTVTWYPKRAGLVDPVYRVQLPSPVFCEYAAFARLMPPAGPLSKEDVKVINYDDTGDLPTGLGKLLGRLPKVGRFVNPKIKAVVGTDDVSNVVTSPFTLSVLDRELGIFRVNSQMDIEGIIGRIEPAHVENIAKVSVNVDGSFLAYQMYLKSTRKLKTIITVVPATPNNDNQIYSVVRKPAVAGQPTGKAPPLNIISTKEVCRVRVDQVISNKEMLDDIADAEAKTQYSIQRDHISGFKRYDGFADRARLAGFCKRIVYNIGDTGISTVHDFTEYPEAAPFYTMVNYESRKAIFRALWDGKD